MKKEWFYVFSVWVLVLSSLYRNDKKESGTIV